jgi:TM2 domain-containing membrane protein YozV
MVMPMADKKVDTSGKKDPIIAALISLVCMIIGAPAVGYFYLDDLKKGIEYLILCWIVLGIFLALYLTGAIFTYGLGLCCAPIFVVPLLLDLIVLVDVYLEAKGEPKLPSI